MNFNELMAKMRELDAPAPTQTSPETTECGEMPSTGPMGSPMSPSMSKPDTPPPSMSVNLNAQGLDNIEELMKLMTKVNPDMAKPDVSMPTIDISPMKPPMPPMGGLGNLDSGPLKMLPDLDKDEPEGVHAEPDADNMGGPSDNDADNMPGGDDDGVSKNQGDIDNDGDHDMDDHDMEKKKDKEEAFMNSPEGGSDTETKGVDDVLMKGNDIHRPKKSFSGKPYRGDNPMAAGAYESTDLRAQIRTELLQRLAEAKGVK